MANKKENLPNETTEVTEEVAVEVAEAAEAPVSEAPVVSETPEAEVAEAATPTEQTPSFWQKTKNGFVWFGRKIKGLFVKEAPQQEASDDPQPPVVIPQELLEGPKLSKGEKFRRFCKSQSGWLFVLPALILLLVFTFYPIVSAFVNAFHQDYKALAGTDNGWGFQNFVRVLKGDTGTGGANFVQCLFNTMVFTFISVPVSILLALLIAVALNSIKPLQKAYQTVLFLPYLTNALAMGAVFATFFKVVGTASQIEIGAGSMGVVNNILIKLGLITKENYIDWTGVKSPVWTLGSLKIPWAKYIMVIVYEIWSGLPFKILILFSALQSVNKQYYDAAKVDGASKSTVLWKITAPMISPMLSYLFITGIMGGMKQYSAIVGLFGPEMGINYDMGTMVGYIYHYVYKGQTGYAAAGSLMLFFIIMIITAINNHVSKKRVTY